jgi:ABC-type lipoprotein release transport system permease subunit
VVIFLAVGSRVGDDAGVRGVIRYRARRQVRAGWQSMLLAALLVGAVFGAGAASAAAARRTDTAYRRFSDDARPWDALYVNSVEEADDPPAVFNAADVREIDGVAEVHQVLFNYSTIGPGTGWLLDPSGRVGSEIARSTLVDGRWFDPAEPSEVVIGLALAERDHLAVGDTFALFPEVYLHQDDSAEGKAFAAAFLDAVPGLRMHVVGIAAAPGQVPPVAELGLPLMQLSPAMAEFQDTDTNALLIFLEPDATPSRLREQLAGVAKARGDDGDLQFVAHEDIARDVKRSLGPQVSMLWVLAGVFAIAGVVLVLQVASRQVDAELDEADVLRALGMDRRTLVFAAAARVACIASVAAVVALAVGIALSPLAPTGLARTIEPDPGLSIDTPALATAALACALVTLVAGVAIGVLRTVDKGRRHAPARSWSFRGGPFLALGLRGALQRGSGRRRVPVSLTLAAMVTGAAAVTASLTVAASLDHQLSDPARYGVRWDAQVAQFTEDTVARDAPARLLDDDRVAGLATGFIERAHVTGRETTVAAMDLVKGDLRPPLVDGSYPAGPDSVALGARTMRDLGVDLGDEVTLAIDELGGRASTFRVVGRVVLPPQGFGGRLDEGILLDGAGAARLTNGTAPSTLFIDMAPQSSVDNVVGDLTDLVGPDGELPSVILPGTPSDIVDLRRARSMPTTFAAVLSVLAVAALVHALLTSVHRRRQETAVLRALGLSSGQLLRVTVYEGIVLAGFAGVTGVLAGLIAGRVAWHALAATIGSHLGARLPILVIVLVPLVGLALGGSIGALVGRRAAKLNPALALRTE